MINMNSFGGNQAKYEAWGDRLKDHAAMDQLTQRVGWEDGKGGFVGCSMHTYSHELFAEQFQVPVVIAELADCLFESCPASEAVGFALEIHAALQVGVDYTKFIHYWVEWLILDSDHGVARFNSDPRIAEIGRLHKDAQTEEVSQEAWGSAAAAADAAAADAAADVRRTARAASARVAAAAAARAAAARVASASAVRADSARAASDAAYADARAASASAARADSAVRRTPRAAQKEKFIELLASNVFPKVTETDRNHIANIKG
jgi:hypothetical protein